MYYNIRYSARTDSDSESPKNSQATAKNITMLHTGLPCYSFNDRRLAMSPAHPPFFFYYVPCFLL